VYNLGTGDPHSFNEMVDMINAVLGTDVEPEYEPVPIENYVHDTCADISKIREATGWSRRSISRRVSSECVGRISTNKSSDCTDRSAFC